MKKPKNEHDSPVQLSATSHLLALSALAGWIVSGCSCACGIPDNDGPDIIAIVPYGESTAVEVVAVSSVFSDMVAQELPEHMTVVGPDRQAVDFWLEYPPPADLSTRQHAHRYQPYQAVVHGLDAPGWYTLRVESFRTSGGWDVEHFDHTGARRDADGWETDLLVHVSDPGVREVVVRRVPDQDLTTVRINFSELLSADTPVRDLVELLSEDGEVLDCGVNERPLEEGQMPPQDADRFRNYHLGVVCPLDIEVFAVRFLAELRSPDYDTVISFPPPGEILDLTDWTFEPDGAGGGRLRTDRRAHWEAVHGIGSPRELVPTSRAGQASPAACSTGAGTGVPLLPVLLVLGLAATRLRRSARA